MREALVRTRTRYINLIGALLRGQGYHVADGSAEAFTRRVEQLMIPEFVRAQIDPLVQVLGPVNTQLEALEQGLQQRAQADSQAQVLMSMPSVGVVTALAFLAALDSASRFENAHQVEAYLGLVPKEYSSGEKQQRGHITKVGGSRMRSLLCQLALSTLRLRKPETEPLWQWAERIAQRRGKKIATIALARRLGGILWAMWRDGSVYQRQEATSQSPGCAGKRPKQRTARVSAAPPEQATA